MTMDIHHIQKQLQKYTSEAFWKSWVEKIGLSEHVPEWGVKVGLEIGSASVKVVQLRESSTGRIVEKMACRELPRDNTKTVREEKGKLSQTIGRLWEELKISEKRVRLIISDPDIYTRHITIPRVGEQELNKAIKWQAEKFVSFPIDNAIVDYQNLDAELKKDPKNQEVILVAVQREVIDDYVAMLRDIPLMPAVIDFSPFAVARAVLETQKIEEDELTAIVDIASRNSTVIIVGSSSLVFVRNVEVSGRNLAEDLKTVSEHSQDAQGVSATQRLGHFVEQIELCFAYCEREFLSQQIHRILICGGGSGIPGLVGFMSQKLHVPVELANPFERLNVDSGISADQIKTMAPRMVAALGGVL